MVVVIPEDFPPQLPAIKRRSKKITSVKRKEVEELLSSITRAAHVARNKGFFTVSPEAIRCVELLRYMRTLPLSARVITQTEAFRALLLLSKNGNIKIRSESRSVADHLKGILQKHNGRDS